MNKIFLIVLVLFVAWRVIGAIGKRLGREGSGADDFSRFSARRRDLAWRRSRREAKGAEDLVACTRCGVHVPASAAVTGEDRASYCSDACAAG